MDDIFGLIYGSYKHITGKLLTEDGVVFNLHFPGYRWKFLEGGPRHPVTNCFKEDTSETDSEDEKLPDVVSDVIEISSDSELERNMVELEAAISLEFSEESD